MGEAWRSPHEYVVCTLYIGKTHFIPCQKYRNARRKRRKCQMRSRRWVVGISPCRKQDDRRSPSRNILSPGKWIPRRSCDTTADGRLPKDSRTDDGMAILEPLRTRPCRSLICSHARCTNERKYSSGMAPQLCISTKQRCVANRHYATTYQLTRAMQRAARGHGIERQEVDNALSHRFTFLPTFFIHILVNEWQ